MANRYPLENFPLIATDCVEKAQFALSRQLTALKVIRVSDQNNFRLQMNGVRIGCTSLLFNRFGSYTRIRSEQPGDAVIFVFGTDINSRFTLDGKPVVVSPHKAAIVAPSQQVDVERPENSEILVLRASMSDLLHHFQIQIDRHHRGSIFFEHSVMMKEGPAGRAKAMVINLINELKANDLILKNPDLVKGYEDMLLNVLLDLPHRDRAKLYENRRNHFAPGIVRRAEEYMRAHLSESVTITDLLLLCSCSRSVLFAAFKNARGYTPMEFLTEQRLQSAREKLLRPYLAKSVSSIALECGFVHLGRFSGLFRSRFGESPSETLQKKRERPYLMSSIKSTIAC